MSRFHIRESKRWAREANQETGGREHIQIPAHGGKRFFKET
jgi:hypothetical protein